MDDKVCALELCQRLAEGRENAKERFREYVRAWGKERAISTTALFRGVNSLERGPSRSYGGHSSSSHGGERRTCGRKTVRGMVRRAQLIGRVTDRSAASSDISVTWISSLLAALQWIRLSFRTITLRENERAKAEPSARDREGEKEVSEAPYLPLFLFYSILLFLPGPVIPVQ